jgi:membrane protein implicated in regulation of membrane protease activity
MIAAVLLYFEILTISQSLIFFGGLLIVVGVIWNYTMARQEDRWFASNQAT